MEPRWENGGSSLCPVFVGGMGRFDLWVSSDPLLRDGCNYLSVVWGPALSHWTRYPIKRGKIGYADFDEIGNPTYEELKLIEHYLRLFAPWVFNKGAA